MPATGVGSIAEDQAAADPHGCHPMILRKDLAEAARLALSVQGLVTSGAESIAVASLHPSVPSRLLASLPVGGVATPRCSSNASQPMLRTGAHLVQCADQLSG